MIKDRVVVAMSGGVDSSVAAALLKSRGYEVIGITMCFNLAAGNKRKSPCCSAESIGDAARVAHKLGIRHYVVNMKKQLEERVIKDFCKEYLSGRTPNPCVKCNQFLKFDLLLNKARSLDAGFLATGHYARIENGLLKKARDLKKDQSYFIYRIKPDQLKHILFPLGEYTKDQVRRLARNYGLSVADKPGSQEICFLPGNNYREFLRSYAGVENKQGKVVDVQGNILGTHKGIPFYTIGQREGLGIARGYPVYVIKLDCRNNRIIVGPKQDAFKSDFLVKDTHYLCGRIKKKVALKVKIRYNHAESPAEIIPFKNKLMVRFRKPQFSITPGQSAVFYKGDQVYGGGIIDKVEDKNVKK
jgi:tRNA-specific 2-thiouridylase